MELERSRIPSPTLEDEVLRIVTEEGPIASFNICRCLYVLGWTSPSGEWADLEPVNDALSALEKSGKIHRRSRRTGPSFEVVK